MRSHAFWQPVYYNLQSHPDWGKKYLDRHQGATGDEVPLVAVASYRKRHGLGDMPLTQVGYEKYTRAAFMEFFLNDPLYVIETKYYNVVNIISMIKVGVLHAWRFLRQWCFVLAALAALGVLFQIRRRVETVSMVTWDTGALLAASLLVPTPMLATVFIVDASFDTMVLAILASLGVALWSAIVFGVFASAGVAALFRMFGPDCRRILASSWPQGRPGTTRRHLKPSSGPP
jgi:hypothetical protein